MVCNRRADQARLTPGRKPGEPKQNDTVGFPALTKYQFGEILVGSHEDRCLLSSLIEYFLIWGTGLGFPDVGDHMTLLPKAQDNRPVHVLVGQELQQVTPSGTG